MKDNAKNEVPVSEQIREVTSRDDVLHPESAVANNGAAMHADVTGVSDRHPSASRIEEIDFAELADGTLVEMVEDPKDPSRSCLAVCKGKEVRITGEVESAGKLMRPISRDGDYVRHIRLPNGAAPYQSVRSLLTKILIFLNKCVDVSDCDRILLATFVVATWFVDRLPVAPYIALVGLPSSGKSTVLRVLRLLCRRSLLTADISSAAFYQVCDELTPTLLIDETATAGDRRSLYHLLRIGTSRDTVTLRKNQSFSAFGAKVVAWVEVPHDGALNSRSVIISLNESRRTDLLRPTDPGILAEAEALQQQLLQYRLGCLNTVSLSPTAGDEILISRDRDLYQAFALGAEPWRKTLVRIFAQQQALTRESLFPKHAAVLYQLYAMIHEPMDATGELGTVKNVADLLNRTLGLLGDSMRLNPREVGAALTTLGINRRKRRAQGWSVFLTAHDRQKIHDLVETHGIELAGFRPTRNECWSCTFCKGVRHPYYRVEA